MWVVPRVDVEDIDALWAIEQDNRLDWRKVRLQHSVRLLFDDFFDWSDDEIGSVRDLGLVRCKIAEPADQQLPAGDLLLDIQLVRFEVE